MRVPLWLWTYLAVKREFTQALLAPLRLPGFWLQKKRWQARVRAAIDAPPPAPGDLSGSEDKLPLKAQVDPERSRVLISCGETSGELHAVNVLQNVSVEWPEGSPKPSVRAFGGAALRQLGEADPSLDLEVVYGLSEHAVMGIKGVLESLPFICKAYATYIRQLRDHRPDLVVLFDYPGLHLVFARAAKLRGIPVIHVAAPQHWAWGPWRVRRYQRAVDLCLTILPFEKAFFEARGLSADYIGHPLVGEVQEVGSRPQTDPPSLVMLPGSRGSEVRLQLDPMLDLALELAERHGPMRIRIPHRSQKRIRQIRARLEERGLTDRIELVDEDPGAVFASARVVLAKSGTGSLESALHGVPTVICFATQGWFARFVRRRLLLAPYIGAANLCAGSEISPEFIVENPEEWTSVRDAVEAFWVDGPRREQALQDLGRLKSRVGEPGAVERIAGWIKLLAGRGLEKH